MRGSILPGATVDGASSSGDPDGGSTQGALFDLGGIPDVRRVDCLECEINLETTQSNALQATMGMPLFVEAEFDGQLVFGLGEAGAGRLAFSGDGNVIYREGAAPCGSGLATPEPSPRESSASAPTATARRAPIHPWRSTI